MRTIIKRNPLPALFIIAMILLIFPTTASAGFEAVHPVCDSATLDAALAEASYGDTIQLECDIQYNKGLVISGKSITFDLNGFVLEVLNTSGAGLDVNNGGTLNIVNGGEFNVTGTTYGVYMHDNGNWACITNATATDPAGIGVMISDFTTVNIIGSINAPIYIKMQGVVKTAADGVRGTADENYLIYNDGISNIQVKGLCKILDKGVYTTLDEALTAASDGDTIQLLQNIDYNKGVIVNGKHITFDLNGFTLNAVSTSGAGMEVSGGAVVDLTGGGAFNVTGTSYGVYTHDYSTATVNNAKATDPAGIGVMSASGGMVTVDRTIAAPTYVRIQGTDKTAEAGIAGTGADENYFLYSDGTSTVRVKGLCKITDKSIYMTLDDALTAASDGDTIQLLQNIDYSNGIIVNGKHITFNLSGFTLNVMNSSGAGLEVSGGAVVDLTGGGAFNVTGTSYGVYTHDYSAATVNNAKATDPAGIGVMSASGGLVTVDGTIAAPTYVRIQGTDKTAEVGIAGTGADENCFLYGDGTSTVRVKGLCKITDKSIYMTLDDALTAASDGDTIQLLQNIDYSNGIIVNGKHITFNLSEFTLNVMNSSGAGLEVSGGAVVDLTGGGAFNATGTTYGVYTNCSTSTVTNATATGCGGKGVSAIYSTVTVKDNATATGSRGTGVYATYSTVAVAGNVTADDLYTSWGASIFSGGKVTVIGNVRGGYAAVSNGIGSKAEMIISGNVIGTNECALGVSGANSLISVGGDVKSLGLYRGIEASDGGTVTISGNLLVNRYSYYESVYAQAWGDVTGGTVTIEGYISDSLHIRLIDKSTGTNTTFQAEDGIAGDAPYENYLIYSDGISTVRVRIPAVPSIDKDTITMTMGNTGSFVINLGASSDKAEVANVVSSNTLIAQVDKASVTTDGEAVTISAIAQGSATVTITFNDPSATIKTVNVTVSNPPSSDSMSSGIIYPSDIDFDQDPVIVSLTASRNKISSLAIKQLVEANLTKAVVIKGSCFNFTFPVGTMKELSPGAYYQFGVLVGDSKLDTANKILQHTYGGSENILIRFSYYGELPTTAKAEVRLKVGTEFADKTFYYYRYNLTTDLLEYLQSTIVDKEGWITVEQSYCSDYLLTSKKLSPNNVIINKIPETENLSQVPYYMESGKETIVKFSAMINDELHFIGNTSTEYLFKENTKSFVDISNHWAEKEIIFITARELFSGTGDGKFSPDAPITRGMVITVLGRLYGANTENLTTNHFIDIAANAWYAPYVEWAAENGIVNGIGNSRFVPERAVTREELSVIIANFVQFTGLKLNEISAGSVAYADFNSISTWAQDSITTLHKAGIISDKGNGIFDPKGPATRAETVVILKRLITNIVQ